MIVLKSADKHNYSFVFFSCQPLEKILSKDGRKPRNNLTVLTWQRMLMIERRELFSSFENASGVTDLTDAYFQFIVVVNFKRLECLYRQLPLGGLIGRFQMGGMMWSRCK